MTPHFSDPIFLPARLRKCGGRSIEPTALAQSRHHFGVRRQSEAATALWDWIEGWKEDVRTGAEKSGVALRLPPQSKKGTPHLKTLRDLQGNAGGIPATSVLRLLRHREALDLTVRPMTFVNDDEIEKVRRILPEIRRGLPILGWPADERLENGEEQARI